MGEDEEKTMRRRFSVKGVDEDALELLTEIREAERRHTGAVVSDAIRYYHGWLFEADDEDEPTVGTLPEYQTIPGY